jgi:SAM-dependent methyltransferase
MLMNREEILALLSPLSLEQGLHLLDSVTWFPETSPDRLERIAGYVFTRSSGEIRPSPEVISTVLRRINEVAESEAESLEGRWADIPNAKHLYELKYDLKTFLLPDHWFTFMNMGWQQLGATDPDLDEWLADGQSVWRYSANLYDMVASQGSITDRDVLEVGSGRGGGAGFLTRRYRPSAYVCVEQSQNNINFSRNTQPRDIDFRQGDAENLPVASHAFDVVINIESAHCYPHLNRFMDEVARVLRPGGQFLFADEWWPSSIPNLHASMQKAGLRITEQRPVTDGIIEALLRLPAIIQPLIDSQSGQQRRVYERFFGKRVLRDSLHSYTSGRFGFYLIVAEASQ